MGRLKVEDKHVLSGSVHVSGAKGSVRLQSRSKYNELSDKNKFEDTKELISDLSNCGSMLEHCFPSAADAAASGAASASRNAEAADAPKNKATRSISTQTVVSIVQKMKRRGEPISDMDDDDSKHDDAFQ